MAGQEIVISQGRWPIARAGMGLALLPIGAGFCFFAYKAMADGFESIFLASLLSALVAVIFGLHFCCTLSRISNRDGVITVVRSIDRVQFLEQDIVRVRTFSIRSNHWGGAMVRLRNRKIPVLMDFVVLDHTNAGDFNATVASLRILLGIRRS